MHILVYSLIGLGALAAGAAAYFGFTFSPIEALLTAIVFAVVAVVTMERRLRRRAELRLERAIDELSRLLSTDAQAGAALSRRINTIADADPVKRIEGLEADVSVLGTVVRQLAETLAEIEAGRRQASHAPAPDDDDLMDIAPYEQRPEPRIAPEAVAEALDQHRLLFHVRPIAGLPTRRPRAFDLVPRLVTEQGDLVEPLDFVPRRGNEALLRRLDLIIVEEALAIIGRVRAVGRPLPLNAPIARPTLRDPAAVERLGAALDTDRTVAGFLRLVLPEADWHALTEAERAGLSTLVDRGVGISIAELDGLRLDFAALADAGVRSVRLDARAFLETPGTFTDFASADIGAYVGRFGVDLVFTGVESEQQIIALLEDGLTLVEGPHIAGPGPAEIDRMVDRSGPVAVPTVAPPRRAER